MPGRCCDRCGSALVKTPTLLELTHESARGTERDTRTLCLECCGLVVAVLGHRRDSADPLEPIRPARPRLATPHCEVDAWTSLPRTVAEVSIGVVEAGREADMPPLMRSR